jgi:hypothetical protein
MNMIGTWTRRITLGAAAIVVATLVGVASPAGAVTSVTNVTVGANPFTPGTASTYTVDFLTSASGTLASGSGTITITDSGSALPAVAADYSVNGTAATTILGSGGSVTVTTPVTIGNVAPVTISITGITTPAAGSYSASVATSADATVVPVSYTIGTATKVVPSSATHGGNNQATPTGTAFPDQLHGIVQDASNATVDQPNIRLTFTVVPGASGAGGTFANSTGTAVAFTDQHGTAITSVLTANGIVGPFTVAVSSNGLTSGTFNECVGTPAQCATPGAPTIGTATAGNASATVTWTAPTTGGTPGSYTVTSSPGGIVANAPGSATSAVVNGLTNGVTYTFTVTATNAGGTSPPSAASNAVTPSSPTPPPPPVMNGNLPGPVTGMASLPDGMGYWLTDASGGVSAHGNAVNYGSMAGTPLNAPVNHIVATPDGKGYWLVAADGGTFTFGDAGFYGSTGNMRLNAPVVDIAPTKSGKGYWLVASDGGIFTFGDAQFFGSMGGKPLNKPVVGISPDYATGGYWFVATDGGIFSFNAPFYGSTGNIVLNQPVNGMTPTPDGHGYWFVASDGGIFSFGDAVFYGSKGGSPLIAPVVGMATNNATGGYWLVASDGGVFSFNAPFFGAD